MEFKKWYLSKTLWTNLLMGVVFVARPDLGEQIGGEQGLALLFTVANVILRVVTKSGLQIK